MNVIIFIIMLCGAAYAQEVVPTKEELQQKKILLSSEIQQLESEKQSL